MFNSVFDHSCDANAAVSETDWWRVTWESRLRATPPPLLCLTREKNSSDAKLKQCAMTSKYARLVEILSRFPGVAAQATRSETVRTSPNCEAPGEQDENRPQETSPPSQEKCRKNQEVTHSMYPLLNQALRQEEFTQTVNRNCQIQGARERNVQIPRATTSSEGN